MIVREAASADVDARDGGHVDSWRVTYRGLVPDDFLDGLTYESRERQWAAALDPSNPDYRGELYAIYIQPARQGMGAGRGLMRAVAAQLAGEGRRSLLVWVLADNPARRFYEALGGRHLRAQPIAIGDATLDEVAYGWPDSGVLLRAER